MKILCYKKSLFLAILIIILILPCELSAQKITTPEEFFGHKVGADYHLINYKRAVDYWKQLEQESDKIKLFEYGKTSYGRTMIFAVISSEENMANLEHYKEISLRIARVRGITDEEAKSLASESKAIVWIDGGLHATEVAPAQHIIQLTYDLLTDNSSKTRRILNEVITMLVLPNPDGMDMVAEWYENNLGTLYEISSLPWLYQKYIGHDNNRDSFMMSVPEILNQNQILYHEWHPHFFYNHHQTSPYGSLIFIQPDCEPTNPNLHPLLLRWQNLIGSALGMAFEAEKKPGVISRYLFDTWYPGYVTQVADFHNIISAFSETFLYRYATPHFYTLQDFPEPFRDFTISMFHTNPWKGGWWRLRDASDYCLTASKALLDLAAKRREELIYAKYWMGKDNMEKFQKEPPYGWIIPQEQRDTAAAKILLDKLIALDIEVYEAEDSFAADGIIYPEGTYILPTSQPFGRFVKTLFEIQHYPDLRKYPMLWQSIVSPLELDIPPLHTYDVLGWTLPLQMGVKAVTMNTPVDINMKRIEKVESLKGNISGTGNYAYLIPSENSNCVIAINRLLKEDADVFWAKKEFKSGGREYAAGTVIVPVAQFSANKMHALAEELSLSVVRIKSKPSTGTYKLRVPRIALYKPWVANMDEGWTRLILENYEFSFTSIHNAEIKAGNLGDRFDVIIFPNQRASSIINGHKPGTMPPDYVGGISQHGVENLKIFIEEGGSLITLGSACNLPVEHFGLPVKNVLKSIDSEKFVASGLLLKIKCNNNHPIGYGMPEEAVGFFANSPTFDLIPSFKDEAQPSVVVKYPGEDILLSGWMTGEKHLHNQGAVVEVPYEKGRVILLGFRVQHRSQAIGTFRLLFNSIYYGAIK